MKLSYIAVIAALAAFFVPVGAHGQTQINTNQIKNGAVTPAKLSSSGGTAGSTTFYEGDGKWATPSGSGTVTSVGLSVPGIFNLSGSPVTSSGSFTVTVANEMANYVWAGPTSGSAAAAAFRALVTADLPSLSNFIGLADLTATGTASSSTYLRGDNSWASLPTATTSVLGLVKPDGSTITISGGVISAVGSGSLSHYFVDFYTRSNVSSLSGLSVNGFTVVNNNVILLLNQTTSTQNGPWVCHSSSWTRPTWYASGAVFNAPDPLMITSESEVSSTGSQIWNSTNGSPCTFVLSLSTGTVTVDTTSGVLFISTSSLTGAPDTLIESPSNGDVLTYSSADGLWENKAGGGGGSGINAETTLPSPSGSTDDQLYRLRISGLNDRLFVGQQDAASAHKLRIVQTVPYYATGQPGTDAVVDPMSTLKVGLGFDYLFNEGSGATLHDYSPHANDAYLNPTTTAPSGVWATDGTYGNILTMGGTEWVEAPSQVSNNSENVSALIIFKTTTAATQVILAKSQGGSTDPLFLDTLSSGKARINCYGGGTQYYATGTATVDDGNWHVCIATRVQGGTMNLYTDGTLDATTTDGSSTGSSVTSYDWTIGTNSNSGTSFTGSIARCVVWNRVLTSGEIALLEADPWAEFR